MATQKAKPAAKTAVSDPRVTGPTAAPSPAQAPAPSTAAADAGEEVKPRAKKKEELVSYAVPRGFKLTLDDGTTKDIEPGVAVDLPRSVGDHWYAKAHGVEPNE